MDYDNLAISLFRYYGVPDEDILFCHIRIKAEEDGSKVTFELVEPNTLEIIHEIIYGKK